MNECHEWINLERERFVTNVKRLVEHCHIALKKNKQQQMSISMRKARLPVVCIQDDDQVPMKANTTKLIRLFLMRYNSFSYTQ